MTGQTENRFLTGDDSAPGAITIAKTLYKIPTLLTTWTRCGKPHCRCREGHLHGPYHALHWREGRVQRRRYVRAHDVAAVRTILEERRQRRRTERLILTRSMRSWHALARLVEDFGARLAEGQEE